MNISLRKKILIVSLITSLIVLTLIFFAIASYHGMLRIHDLWHKHENIHASATLQLSGINRQLGYGGMIHNLKNFILRKDPSLVPKIEKNFRQIDQHLRYLRQIALLRNEKYSLQKIEQTLKQYRKSFALTQVLVRKNLSPQEIDQQVKVDDRYANQALDALTDSIVALSLMHQEESEKVLRQAVFLSILLFFLIPPIGGMGVYLIYNLSLTSKANEKAQVAAETKNRFLANMSHEIRTPLNSMIGMTNLLYKTPLNPMQVKYLTSVRKEAQNLLGLLNDILDISKLEQQKMQLQTVHFNLQELAQEVMDSFLSESHRQGLKLQLFYDAALYPYRIGDSVRIRQVIYNLLSNAIKFTTQGGVSLTLSALEESALKITIEDTGRGIPEPQQQEIFKAFTQADNHITKHGGGTGLGMALVKEICDLLQARLSLTSEPGKGSCFTIELSLPRSTPYYLASDPSHLSPLRILVAETQEESRALIELHLSEAGHKVFFALNKEEVVECWKNNPFDLILLDMQMPEKNGYQAARAIRRLEAERGGHIPIIALTASAVLKNPEQYFLAGIDDYLSKPIDLADFEAKATSLMQATHSLGNLHRLQEKK